MKELNIPLGIASLEIVEQSTDKQGNIILTVKSTKKESRCHKCGKSATIHHGYAPMLEIRHLSILDTPVYLRIRPLRYKCEHCDNHPTTTEQYDWCERKSKTTKAYDEYVMRNLINGTIADVSRKEKLGYKSITSIVNRKINKEVNWSGYDDLDTIGIDEISDKKGHADFLTIISSKSKTGKLSVIAVLKGRKKETIMKFLKSIPKPLKKTVTTVCTDMYDGYVNSAKSFFGEQIVVIDRYHVAKLYRRPLDKLRIKEMKRLKKKLIPVEYGKLEGMMWILRKNHECLTQSDKESLSLLYKHSPKLKKAHHYAIKLTNILNTHTSRKLAQAKIERWVCKVKKSGLRCFDQFIMTLEKYKTWILNYFKKRANSGFVEGLNNKIKVIKRRCYGFFKTESLFQRLWLDLSGYDRYINSKPLQTQ